MSDEYTPSDAEIRDAYVYIDKDRRWLARAEFARWLAEHDEAVIRTHAETIAKAQREAVTEAIVQAHGDAISHIAETLAQPGILWHGDGGVQVLVDARTMVRIPLVDWLHARAAAVRGEGRS